MSAGDDIERVKERIRARIEQASKMTSYRGSVEVANWYEDDAPFLLAALDRLQGRLAEAERALRPFAEAVRFDGYQTTMPIAERTTHDDWITAATYFGLPDYSARAAVSTAPEEQA